MKAAVINRYGGPEVFEIEDLPEPKIKKKEILIKVSASSINPIDYKTRKGNLRYILGSHFPIVLGYDVCGEVVKIGTRVTRFKVGDVIYGRLDRKYGGTYAEYAAGAETSCALKPFSLTDEEAAAVPLASLTALQGLRDKGRIMAGDRVLINGASGGVGHFAVQLAKIADTECYAVCSGKHKKLMSELAPTRWIDYAKEDFKKLDVKFDIIFDIAGTETFRTCKDALVDGGIYITTLPRPKVFLHKILALFTRRKRAKTLLMKALSGDMEYVAQLIDMGKIKVKVDKVFPLDQIAEAHKYAEGGHLNGKVVIKIADKQIDQSLK